MAKWDRYGRPINTTPAPTPVAPTGADRTKQSGQRPQASPDGEADGQHRGLIYKISPGTKDLILEKDGQ